MTGAFDICGPLPTGTTVLEASAGTGKTYAIGALVVRYVAEGVATLDELLVVTFGRAATQELRERVREHLVAAHRALGDPARALASDDALVRLLASSDVPARRARLGRALADFDAATIATTHQFCQLVLAGLGVAGDSDTGATFVESLDDLVVEVVDDLYIRVFGDTADKPFMSRATALAIARDVVNDPQARIEPAEAEGDALRRVRFARAVREYVEKRKRQRGLMSFDDLLTRLADTLEPEAAAARERMRARWRIVLVDEFQDTDPVQWRVLENAFHGHTTMVLIGDPKQAIYAFRGGDVATYLLASQAADTHATLATNWRSDSVLVDALDAFFDGAALGEDEIVVRSVGAAHQGSRLAGGPSAAPLRLRVVRRDQGETYKGLLKVGPLRKLVAADLAADVAALLASGAAFDGRPVRPADVAILVEQHRDADIIREALAAKHIPVVVAGGKSVYSTPAAEEWLTLLQALEQPHRSRLARAAALTPFLGYTAEQLGATRADLDDEIGTTLRNWANLLASKGVAALVEVATAEHGLPARLLRLDNGERRLTDLLHIGQGLHAAAVREGLGVAALVNWLRQRRAEAADDQNPERTRRLDSDAAAVQVMTVWASKGLQFPIVYLPFGYDRWVRDDADLLLLHDAERRRVRDVGGKGTPARADRARTALRELAGESLRLQYVAMTRAQSQVVCWWAPSNNTRCAPLHRLLFGRSPGEAGVPDEAPVPTDDAAAAKLAQLAARGGPVVEAAVASAAAPPPVVPPTVATELSVATFDRALDLGWRRTSYTALTAAADQHAGVGSEPETEERQDEGTDPLPLPPPADPALLQVVSPMAALPVGASFGTLVHAVLEEADPHAADLRAELAARAAEQLAWRAVDVSAGALADALLPVMDTPLGPLAGGARLRDIGTADRLTELDFELPLAGGDDPTAAVSLRQVADVWRATLPPDDPLAGYAGRLAAPDLAGQPLRGYLTGSLDLVLRLNGPRYLVADYKTNWLGTHEGEQLSAWHYRPDALAAVMRHSHYPLQAALYCVALHRFLRWRQPGYDPDVHLGGVLYLFVRGMSGAATPVVDGVPCGVFGWQPPAAMVTALSDLLDGR